MEGSVRLIPLIQMAKIYGLRFIWERIHQKLDLYFRALLDLDRGGTAASKKTYQFSKKEIHTNCCNIFHHKSSFNILDKEARFADPCITKSHNF